MTRKNANFPFYLGMAVAVGILIGGFFNFSKYPTYNTDKESKLQRLLGFIQYDYVDEVDTDQLLDGVIDQMLQQLDPHSVYIPKEEMQRVTERMQGKFVGIGVTFLMHKDSVTVTDVIPGGPSESAGLLPGDRILIADKDTLFGEVLFKKAGIVPEERNSYTAKRKLSDKVIKTLKGNPGTEVRVTLYRRSSGDILEVPITRGEVPIKSVTGFYMINQVLGYINIDRFARTTHTEFKQALQALIEKGMTSLVLDLRGNPGGFMDVANRIIDEFLEDGTLIVYTKNKGGRVQKSFATNKGAFEKGNVYVLIDRNSASASEILAGALQDNDKGTIVGRRSFGKGLVQQEMDLGDGSAVRLTTSRYYTPTGRSIQKPYKDLHAEGYALEEIGRQIHGELIYKDSIRVVDSLQFKTPGGKIVYGGGGIIPDVFVPIDTAYSYSNQLYGGLNDFAFSYVDAHRTELATWKLDDFVERFDMDEAIFRNYLFSRKIGDTLAPGTRKNLNKFFRAVMARNVFDETGFYRISQTDDPMILKVLELENQGK